MPPEKAVEMTSFKDADDSDIHLWQTTLMLLYKRGLCWLIPSSPDLYFPGDNIVIIINFVVVVV